MKWQEMSVNKKNEHILLIIFIIYYWFTNIFIYWYSFFIDAVKDFLKRLQIGLFCACI